MAWARDWGPPVQFRQCNHEHQANPAIVALELGAEDRRPGSQDFTSSCNWSHHLQMLEQNSVEGDSPNLIVGGGLP